MTQTTAIGACSTCKFWEPPSAPPVVRAAEEEARPGRCHYNAPIVLDRVGERTVWPRTYAGDWCGQYAA